MSKIVINGFLVKPMQMFILEEQTEVDGDPEYLTTPSPSKEGEDSASVTDKESSDILPLC